MAGFSKWSLSFRFPCQIPLCTFPLPHTCYMPCPSHSSRFYHLNNIWLGVQIIKHLIMYYSQLPYHLNPLRPKYLLSTLFSNTLSLHSSLSVSNQFSHPYKTTGRIEVLHIVVFIFLDSKLEDKRYLHRTIARIPDFNLLLISS